MKQFKSIILCLFILVGCTISPEKKIVDSLLVINRIDNSINFDFFHNVLSENEVLILGEASHGDGKTFKIKSEMVKYLLENHGYNTIAFESRDFLEMEIINGKKEIDSLAQYLDHDNWVRQWSPWGAAKQIQTLVDIAQSKANLMYIGLETYAFGNIQHIIRYLKNELAELNIEIFDFQVWDTLQNIHLKMVYPQTGSITNDDFIYYLNYLEKKYSYLKQFDDIKNNHILFLSQVVENLITYTKIYQTKLSDLPEEDALNKFVKLRDKQMADNLLWYKKRNPEAKIIVWMANFHGAIDLKNILFADGDPETYTKFDVFGEHISAAFGDKVFSIAYTSSEGKSKMPYNFEGIEEQIIDSNEDTLEKALGRIKSDYGFINFREIRNTNPSLADTYFNSIMLGYVNQKGKWLNSFDGLFYIKKQEPAIPVGF